MAGEPTITIIGNMVAEPELRFTASGVPVANFTVAATPRTFDKQRGEWVDGEALFMRCVAWKQLAENTAESLVKGLQVIVQGRLRARSYETKDGDRRTATELEVDAVGPSLQFVTATVNRGGTRPRDGGFTGPTAATPGGFGDGGGFGGFDTTDEAPF